MGSSRSTSTSTLVGGRGARESGSRWGGERSLELRHGSWGDSPCGHGGAPRGGTRPTRPSGLGDSQLGTPRGRNRNRDRRGGLDTDGDSDPDADGLGQEPGFLRGSWGHSPHRMGTPALSLETSTLGLRTSSWGDSPCGHGDAPREGTLRPTVGRVTPPGDDVKSAA
jgi:hypothetical protein